MLNQSPVVYVVDADASVRETLIELICRAGWEPSVFASAEEFLRQSRRPVPSCLILEVMLPGLDGLALQQQLVHERLILPIIFITHCSEVAITVRAMKAGAAEFLTKPFSSNDALEAVSDALSLSRTMLRTALENKTLWERFARLTKREREVMSLITSGLMNKTAGNRLGLSEITVKAHRGRVMRKMQARSLADLVIMAAQLHIPASRPPPLTETRLDQEARPETPAPSGRRRVVLADRTSP